MSRIKIMSVVGARPNFVKVAPLSRQMEKAADKIEHILVHTGQHHDFKMSRGFFVSLLLPDPSINLGVRSASRAVQVAEIMTKLEQVCIAQKPDWVVVFGDVNSTLAAAIVAKKLGIKLAHVEAGLRSFDISMPEEINRKVTDSLSDLLFTHSPEADKNLIDEGVKRSKIKMVGNIMIDTLVAEMAEIDQKCHYEKWHFKQKGFVYVTLHRPFNVDDRYRFSEILQQLKRLSRSLPIVFSIHPRTQKNIRKFGLKRIISKNSRLVLTGPLNYHESISCVKNALFVLTDSGGLQEEAAYLGTKCLTLRPNTERPVTIKCGTNKLTCMETLWDDIGAIMDNSDKSRRQTIPYLWDGKTAKRIVDTLLKTHI